MTPEEYIKKLEDLLLLTLAPGWGCMTDVREFKEAVKAVMKEKS